MSIYSTYCIYCTRIWLFYKKNFSRNISSDVAGVTPGSGSCLCSSSHCLAMMRIRSESAHQPQSGRQSGHERPQCKNESDAETATRGRCTNATRQTEGTCRTHRGASRLLVDVVHVGAHVGPTSSGAMRLVTFGGLVSESNPMLFLLSWKPKFFLYKLYFMLKFESNSFFHILDSKHVTFDIST